VSGYSIQVNLLLLTVVVSDSRRTDQPGVAEHEQENPMDTQESATQETPVYEEPVMVDMGAFAEVTRGGDFGPDEFEDDQIFG
jgi:hypothetical protein